MREHRSQMNSGGWFFAVAEATGDSLGVALHTAARRADRRPDAPEDDLFAGVRGAG